MTHRWMKFWPQDWQSDPGLRGCSLAARGLWIECMAIMHRAVPYGHLIVNGRAPTDRQIASMVGASEREVSRLISELEQSGVFSRDVSGVIFSRRMVRDHEHAKAGREAVSKRWEGAKSDVDPNSPPNRVPNRGSTATPNSLDTEAEAETDKKEPSSLRSEGAVPAPLDARTDLFRNGLAAVRRLTGLPDNRARSLVGKLLKAAGDNAAAVSEAIARCGDARPADPVPWLMQACHAPQFRNGFLAVIAAEGWGEGGPEPEEARNPFLIGGKHGAH